MVERLYVVGLATVYRCWEVADGWVLSGSLHWQGRPSNKIKAQKNKSGRVFILGKKIFGCVSLWTAVRAIRL